MNYRKLILLLIFTVAVFIRFYNYPNRITFGPEQAISLINSGHMVTEKFTLLGNQNLLRKTASGHSLFAGALFNYSLIPFLLLFKFDPYPITVVFTLLNLFSGVIIYHLTKKMTDTTTAIFAFFLFMFSSFAVYFSMFIWNQNFMFLFGILSLYLIYSFRKNKKLTYIFFLGLVSGAAYTVQDLQLLAAALIIIYLLIIAKEKLKVLLLFVLGAAMPNLPAIIFDLRNNFYHLSTAIEYVKDSLIGGHTDSSLSVYHFMFFFPFVIVALAIFVKALYKKNKILVFTLLGVYFYLNITSNNINFNSPTGMPQELTIKNIKKAAQLVAEDNPQNFNLAVLIDFDSRGHILRYPVEFLYKDKPLGVTKYPESNTLYVLAENNYDFKNSKVWEISSFPKDNIVRKSVTKNYSVFVLSKN